jgi:hypothetical protein
VCEQQTKIAQNSDQVQRGMSNARTVEQKNLAELIQSIAGQVSRCHRKKRG